MTTKSLTIKFVNFSNLFCHGISPERQFVIAQFSLNFSPLDPLQEANLTTATTVSAITS